MIETNMKVINEEEPSQKTARLLDVSEISKPYLDTEELSVLNCSFISAKN
jgi:hypothetical protein